MPEEIGLSWVAAQCDDLVDLPVEDLDSLAERGPLAAVVRIAERSVTDLDRPAALQLGRDVRRLLDSPLAEETLHTVWLGSTDKVFDPARDGVGARDWLRGIEEAWLSAQRRDDPAFVPPAAGPVTDEELRRAVLRVMAPLATDLTNAAETGIYPLPLPGLVPAQEQVVVQCCADLGYRMFLRAVKAYFVAVDENTRDALVALGERFGYPRTLVEGGLNHRE
ncbi:hypothetical protein [Streptomyces resistomycificus]|uniref:hypothetical protein n=1 Tax=Streptomyces resistomycificus TaxID=67356 RepID=UPI00068D394F|nr:hypothetical protein [Streptomyces resistomycificus]KUN93071.1 hypothetical protein AQJ84_31235 [Streptomyces resistomycificus]